MATLKPEIPARKKARIAGEAIFLVDTSASARNSYLESEARLLEEYVKRLAPGTLFNVLTYDVVTKAAFERSLPVTADNVAKALDMLRATEPMGATDIGSALARACSLADPTLETDIIVMGDGIATLGETEPGMPTLNGALKGKRIVGVTIGDTGSTAFFDMLAASSDGCSAKWDSATPPADLVTSLLDSLGTYALTDISVDVNREIVKDYSPQCHGLLRRGETITVTGEFAKAEPAAIVISGMLGTEPFEQYFTLDFSKPGTACSGIGRLWACETIKRLEDSVDESKMDEHIVTIDRIVTLSKRFSVSSRYTSLLVLETDTEFERWKTKRLQDARDKLKIGEDTPSLEVLGMNAEHASTGFRIKPEGSDTWLDLESHIRAFGKRLPLDCKISVPFGGACVVRIGEKTYHIPQDTIARGTDFSEGRAPVCCLGQDRHAGARQAARCFRQPGRGDTSASSMTGLSPTSQTNSTGRGRFSGRTSRSPKRSWPVSMATSGTPRSRSRSTITSTASPGSWTRTPIRSCSTICLLPSLTRSRRSPSCRLRANSRPANSKMPILSASSGKRTSGGFVPSYNRSERDAASNLSSIIFGVRRLHPGFPE